MARHLFKLGIWDSRVGSEILVTSSGADSWALLVFIRDKHPGYRNLLAKLSDEQAERCDLKVHVIDKTKDGLRDSILDRPNVIVHRRPRDEPYFTTVAVTSLGRAERVCQFHEDDSVDLPPVPIFGRPEASIPVRLPRSSERSHEDQQPNHQSLFFGAIRLDIWNLFREFCSQMCHPSPALDRTLVTWLQSLPIAVEHTNYTYNYVNSNWQDFEACQMSNEDLAREFGWGALASSEAVAWMIYFDNLCSLLFLSRVLPPAGTKILYARLMQSYPPFISGDRASAFARRCPEALRAAITTSRGYGRGLRRVSALTSQMRKNRLLARSRVWRLVHAGPNRISLTMLEEVVLPAIAAETLPPLTTQCDLWMRQIGDLRRLAVQEGWERN
jgi:hypothetical protein